MAPVRGRQDEDLMQLTLQVRNRKDNDEKYARFHGDNLIGNQTILKVGFAEDVAAALQPKNWPSLKRIVDGFIKGTGLDGQGLATIAGSLSNYSVKRQKLIDGQVKSKYDKMLHPPLTYLGDAFQYRTADGKFNSVLNPHLGQAGAPYAKTVPSKTAPLGALPDPSDVFEKLMKREEGGRQSKSGLSSMLIYHATIIIHDIFRTNDSDKNISDSSSYLDLSPLYGYTMEMQRKVRDDKYMLGLLKPDTFAEDRLLRQPPGVCIMLVMYNRYHNYAAKQLYRINENGRFSVPRMYANTKLVSLVKMFVSPLTDKVLQQCDEYEAAWHKYQAAKPDGEVEQDFEKSEVHKRFDKCKKALDRLLENVQWRDSTQRKNFEVSYDAAWNKLDDDLFNTARLITCGMYIQVSVHDYLRALMGFHQFDTNFTLDPRSDFDQKKTTRGIGNQVTVEFNLLYRFHCAISLKDEAYTEEFISKWMDVEDPKNTSLQEFLGKMKAIKAEGAGKAPPNPWTTTFGIPYKDGDQDQDKSKHFERNSITHLFDDQQMIQALTVAMDDPISNFGPRNIPQCLKPVEIMGILQARKWEVGTLNDFREFFELDRHETFESITKNIEIQNALRDLYEHPDKVELYPGIFCESDEYMGLDPGPKEASSALWSAIFSDAITLVRSDRFYTVDWNTNSLTSWGMKEVTPDNEICKSSVFHRLIQRAFPGWFPYNSIRFFHPFYTAEQNAIYAKAQGYGPDFKETQIPEFDVVVSPPAKPQKPIYLEDFESIAHVLEDPGRNFLHPALYHSENLPKKMEAVLDPDKKKPTFASKTLHDHLLAVESDLQKYLNDLMRSVIKRESIAMTNSTFQIDATRDFAIPVVTRYVADFLGFGHKLRTDSNLSKALTENEIYQHITNCQMFLSYNADETKLLKRRKAFRDSMVFLTDLTERGSIAEANSWSITQALFGKQRTNAMTELGFFIAQKVLEYEKDAGKAAAILLLICLDFAYNSVVSFTAVLDDFMTELYKAADTHVEDLKTKPPRWITVQMLAFSAASKDHTKLEQIIQRRSQAAVRLPILRTAVVAQDDTPMGPLEEGQTLILDLQKATAKAETAGKGNEVEFLTFQLSFAEKFGVFQPRRFAVLALTSMVKFVAQMKNPRRGHDAQGKLKKIHLGWTAEGYSNFMAPMRMEWIAEQVENLPANDVNKNIFTPEVLRPETDTYLTPNWDEMVPFPMTWKIRYDGFGESDYRSDDPKHPHPYGRLATLYPLPDWAPPWYQPSGASHFGGTFADVSCICAAAKVAQASGGDASAATKGQHEPHCPCVTQADKPVVPTPPQLSTGCGLSDSRVH